MQMIQKYQFDERIRSDPHRHIADFLEISSLFHYGENQEKSDNLRTFPFSLSGKAQIWLNELNEGILDTRGILLYKTTNEALRILEHKVLLKLDFSKEPYIKPYPKTIVSVNGSTNNSDHTILMEKPEALASIIDFEFFKIRGVLKEMRDGHKDNRGNYNADCYMKDDMPMCEHHQANYVQGYHK
ncbi:hypothetical protein Tco_0868589 [Tanacetum coccineum]